MKPTNHLSKKIRLQNMSSSKAMLFSFILRYRISCDYFTLIEALHTNKQVYLTYYKRGQCITETGFIQFVDSLGDLFIFIDDV
ncbi:hypothetical protein PVE99_30600, partial [Priestia megaterium]|nr:hypothetical protein [Priestia megaterium]